MLDGLTDESRIAPCEKLEAQVWKLRVVLICFKCFWVLELGLILHNPWLHCDVGWVWHQMFNYGRSSGVFVFERATIGAGFLHLDTSPHRKDLPWSSVAGWPLKSLLGRVSQSQ